MQTHRNIAKRKALFWQVGAVALLGAAGAAIALPQIRTFFAPSPPPKFGGPIVLAPVVAPNYTNLAMEKMRKGASETGVQVAVVAPAPAAPVGPAPADIVASPAPATDWAYLGSIITPKKRSALVLVDGQQQIYSVGATHGEAKLVTIETEFIELETGTGVEKERKKISLQPRKLLATTDPPRHPGAMRQVPGVAMGMGGAGGALNLNTSGRGPGAQPAATFEQARVAALAAAEAAARARPPTDIPGMMPLEKLDQGELEAASKYLSDPTIGDDARTKYLQMLGIGRGVSTDNAATRLKEAGVDMNTEAGKHIMQVIESNSRSKP